eukprot:2686841-Pyramimonas_sp.AAC.1
MTNRAAFAVEGEPDARCAKYLTERKNVEYSGEDYASIGDIAQELIAANCEVLTCFDVPLAFGAQ